MARDFPASNVMIQRQRNRGNAVTVRAILVIAALLAIGFVLMALAGCASPGGQFTDHSSRALRQEGPSSSDASIFMQDGTDTEPASSSLQGGYGPSRVVADKNGVSSASTISQNVATLWLPFDSNGDGVLSEFETNILNFAGSSDLNASGVRVSRTSFFRVDGTIERSESTVQLDGFSSNNSAVATATVPIIAEHVKAYMAASADRRAQYDRYMETAQVAIREGRLTAEAAAKIGLSILTGGASAAAEGAVDAVVPN